MSPFRNPLNLPIRLANRVAGPPRRAAGAARASPRAGVADLPLSWEIDHGIWFDNGLMTVVLNGRQAASRSTTRRVVAGRQVLQRT